MVKEIPKFGKTWSISIDVKFTKDGPYPGNIFMLTTRAEWEKMKERYEDIQNNPSRQSNPSTRLDYYTPASWPALGVGAGDYKFHFDYSPPGGWDNSNKGFYRANGLTKPMEWELIGKPPPENTTEKYPQYLGTNKETWRCSGEYPFHCIEYPNSNAASDRTRFNYLWTETAGKHPYFRKTWDQTDAQKEILRRGFLD